MNLFVAFVWLLLTVLLFGYEPFGGGTGLRIRLGGWNLGWLTLALGIYRLIGWYRIHSWRARQRALESAETGREMRHLPGAEERTPDPNFQFTDEPLPPAKRKLTDQPPSNN